MYLQEREGLETEVAVVCIAMQGITLKDDSLYVLVHKHNTSGTESSGIASFATSHISTTARSLYTPKYKQEG